MIVGAVGLGDGEGDGDGVSLGVSDGLAEGLGDGLAEGVGLAAGVLFAVSVVDVHATDVNASRPTHAITRNQPLISVRKCKGCQIRLPKFC